jgi:hypothetical protein
MTEEYVRTAPVGTTFYHVSPDGYRLDRLVTLGPADADGCMTATHKGPDGSPDMLNAGWVSARVVARDYHPTFAAAKAARVAELEDYLAHARALQPPEDDR